MDPVESREIMVEEALSHAGDLEKRLGPLERLEPSRPLVFVSIGGGELGDLVLSTARTLLGGRWGGVRTVAVDRYEGFPAQDVADAYEIVDIGVAEEVVRAVKRHVKDPGEPHAIYVEIETADPSGLFEMGVREGYNVVSSPYAPVIGLDRLATKLLFEKLGLPMTRWEYANSREDLLRAAKRLGLPVIVKPIRSSSGHGMTIARSWGDVEKAYQHSIEHARGRGDEVIVEEFLEDLKREGVEATQIVARHFSESRKVVETPLPAVEHQRPGATYHESWMPSTLPRGVVERCREYAAAVARSLGGLGLYSVEQFVIGGRIYNSEFANRPHDTGMVTRWAMRRNEGELHMLSSIGIPLTPSDFELTARGLYAAAHVILAPEGVRPGARVAGWDLFSIRGFLRARGYVGDVWFFGKPAAYPGRRMGLAAAFHESLSAARRAAEEIAHFAEKMIFYEG